MTTKHRQPSRRRLDVASLVLLLIGVSFGIFSYWLVTVENFNVIVLIPSIVAATVGATNLTKYEAPRC